MKKMKFKFATGALIITMLCIQSMAVYATPVEETVIGGIIEPCYEYTSSAIADLSISGGSAEVYGSLMGYSGITDKVSMYLYLQRYENGTWITVASFYESFSYHRGLIEETVNVDKGYLYRVKGSYYAYNGSDSENIIRYSATVEY